MKFLFTGNNTFSLRESIKKWKDQFIEKYGDFGFTRINDLSSISLAELESILLSQSFLGEKKLIIINFSNEEKQEVEDFFLNKFLLIPEENISIIYFPDPDKRKKIYKYFLENCELKDFFIENNEQKTHFLQKKYLGKINLDTINFALNFKGYSLEKTILEFEKILITKDIVEKKDIEQNFQIDLEENIFVLIDNILNKNFNQIFKNIDDILLNTNIYIFYRSLISNLSINILIMSMKELQVKNIGEILNLGKRSFLVNKNYKISCNELKNIYIQLVEVEKKIKSGKMFLSGEDIFRYAIERCFIQKNLI